MQIDWVVAAKVVVSVIIYAFIVWAAIQLAVSAGRRFEAMIQAADEQRRIDADRCERLAVLATIADEVEAMPPERRRLYREAEALGFLDSDDLPRMQA